VALALNSLVFVYFNPLLNTLILLIILVCWLSVRFKSVRLDFDIIKYRNVPRKPNPLQEGGGKRRVFKKMAELPKEHSAFVFW